jgi:opacity protein-like surface antigen
VAVRTIARRWIVIQALGLIVLGAGLVAAAEEQEHRYGGPVAPDTDRFYFYFQTGHAGIIDEDVAGDASFDTPDGINVVLGGGGGYNFSKHWGFEIQGHGTEPDVRSSRYGKFREFSNITIIPAIRFRYPVGDGRLVPFLTAGLGGALYEVNDTGNPRIKLEADRYSLAGSIAAGVEYFLTDDVAFGLTLHSFLYPDIDTEMVVRDNANRVVLDDDSSTNMTAVSVLAHMRVMLGEAAGDGKPGNYFLADHGPFDTAQTRVYLYLMGGHTQILDDDFGNLELKAPGDFNATLGGGLGVNLSRHWGAELQLVNSEPNINLTGIGKFAELSNFLVLPMVRFRWPFCGGRLVPFATAGVGVSFNDIGDARGEVDQFAVGTVSAPQVRLVDDTTVVGTVGIGVEYFLNRHLSLGVAIPAYIYPDADADVTFGTAQGGGAAGRTERSSFNLTGIAGLLQIKVLLP